MQCHVFLLAVYFYCFCLCSDQTKWTPRRSASSGDVLDNIPGLSQRLSQAAHPSLSHVPSENMAQPSSAPPAPPLPAINTGGLAEALQTAQLRKTSKVYVLLVDYLRHDQ